jgi:hypothetical protein
LTATKKGGRRPGVRVLGVVVGLSTVPVVPGDLNSQLIS